MLPEHDVHCLCDMGQWLERSVGWGLVHTPCGSWPSFTSLAPSKPGQAKTETCPRPPISWDSLQPVELLFLLPAPHSPDPGLGVSALFYHIRVIKGAANTLEPVQSFTLYLCAGTSLPTANFGNHGFISQDTMPVIHHAILECASQHFPCSHDVSSLHLREMMLRAPAYPFLQCVQKVEEDLHLGSLKANAMQPSHKGHQPIGCYMRSSFANSQLLILMRVSWPLLHGLDLHTSPHLSPATHVKDSFFLELVRVFQSNKANRR